MSSIASGLAALQQAQADETAAIQENTAATTAVVAEVAALSAQLSSLNSEDPAVAVIAADLELKVQALQQNTAALTAATTPAPAPTA